MRRLATDKSLVGPRNHLFRPVVAVVVAANLFSSIVAQTGLQRHRLNEDAALELPLRTLKRDHVYESESHWIASATLRKKRPARTFSLFSAKSTTSNAAAIPK